MMDGDEATEEPSSAEEEEEEEEVEEPPPLDGWRGRPQATQDASSEAEMRE